MERNPNWRRDELILALDLYMRIGHTRTAKETPEIIALSGLLNSLPLHPRKDHRETFRNPNGVSMKLSNFLRFDPRYPGVGLQRGNSLERAIWDEFAHDPNRLRETAQAIQDSAQLIPPPSDKVEVAIDEDEEFPEGRLLTQLHRRRERNPHATRKKKQRVLTETGALKCEVCGFDFRETYGDLGDGFAECHHRRPLAEVTKEKAVKLKDLAIVCANCHRMLHRTRPLLKVEELRALFSSRLPA